MALPIQTTYLTSRNFKVGMDPVQLSAQEIFPVNPASNYEFDDFGNSVAPSRIRTFDYFDLLPATAVAAGTDKYYLLYGANTPTIAQSTTAGALLTSGATATNSAGLAGIASTGSAGPITVNNGLKMQTRINLASLTTMYAVAGWTSNVATPIAGTVPGASATEQALFLADPGNTLSATNTGGTITAATAAQALNWIVCSNVNGTTVYTFTNVPIVAGLDVVLTVALNGSGQWTYYINNVLVATQVATATANAAMKAVVSVLNTASAAASMSVRYLDTQRFIG